VPRLALTQRPSLVFGHVPYIHRSRSKVKAENKQQVIRGWGRSLTFRTRPHRLAVGRAKSRARDARGVGVAAMAWGGWRPEMDRDEVRQFAFHGRHARLPVGGASSPEHLGSEHCRTSGRRLLQNNGRIGAMDRRRFYPEDIQDF
jgi:hypothetical protein